MRTKQNARTLHEHHGTRDFSLLGPAPLALVNCTPPRSAKTRPPLPLLSSSIFFPALVNFRHQTSSSLDRLQNRSRASGPLEPILSSPLSASSLSGAYLDFEKVLLLSYSSLVSEL